MNIINKIVNIFFENNHRDASTCIYILVNVETSLQTTPNS